MTLRFISPSEIFLMNDRPFYPTTFSTSPLGCLTATSNLLCPKTNSFHCLQWQLYSSGCLSQRGQNLGIILDSSLSQTLSNPSANSINSSSKYTQNTTCSSLHCCHPNLATFILLRLLQKLLTGLPAPALACPPFNWFSVGSHCQTDQVKARQITPLLKPLHWLLQPFRSADCISSHTSLPQSSLATAALRRFWKEQPIALSSLCTRCTIPWELLSRYLPDPLPHLTGLYSSVIFSMSSCISNCNPLPPHLHIPINTLLILLLSFLSASPLSPTATGQGLCFALCCIPNTYKKMPGTW